MLAEPAAYQGDPTTVRNWIEAWIRSDALRSLLEDHGFNGVERIGTEPLDATLAALDEFAGSNWDFRQGKERNEARTADLTAAQKDAVLRASATLGLLNEGDVDAERLDHILILGGLVRACLLRPLLAKRVHDRFPSADVAGLGGTREFNDTERDLSASLGLPDTIGTEMAAMDLGIRQAFGLAIGSCSSEVHTDEAHPNLSWEVRSYPFDRTRLLVVSAPSTAPERRANSADSFEFWAKHVAQLREGDSILLVTTAIYVPYQHCEAIRTLGLPYGVHVRTLGVDTSRAQGPLRQEFTAAQYLQEFRSTIGAMCRLIPLL